MNRLRESAREQPCMIRLGGICNFDPATTVLAHFRMAGYSGMSYKAEDLFAAFACSACHDAVDRRRYLHLDPDKLDLAHLRGMIRTQAYWLEEGLIAICPALNSL